MPWSGWGLGLISADGLNNYLLRTQFSLTNVLGGHMLLVRMLLSLGSLFPPLGECTLCSCWAQAGGTSPAPSLCCPAATAREEVGSTEEAALMFGARASALTYQMHWTPSRADTQRALYWACAVPGATPARAWAAQLIPHSNPGKQHPLLLHTGKLAARDGNSRPGLASTFRGLFPPSNTLDSTGLKLG